MPWKQCFLAAILLWVTSTATAAQQTIRIPSKPICERCQLRVRHVLTLGSRDGDGIIPGLPRAITRDGRGHILLAAPNDGGIIRAFDASGKFLESIGRSGRGPGEFSFISALVVGPGDSLYVFDQGNLRLTVLTPEWDHHRTGPMTAGSISDAARTPGHGFVVSMEVPSPELVGIPLHQLNHDGAILHSFGSERPLYRADARWLARRSIAVHESKVWSAHQSQYVLELWRIGGRMEKQLIRDADYFRPWIVPANPTPETPPSPSIFGIQPQGANRIWVGMNIADEDYADALSDRPTFMEGQLVYRREKDFSSLFDTLVELLDTSTGRVIGRVRVDQFGLDWLGPNELVTYREDESGTPLIDIWEVQLSSSHVR